MGHLIFKLIATVFLSFVLLKMGWPWPILLIPSCVLIFALELPSLSLHATTSVRFLAFLICFLTFAALISWVVAEILFLPTTHRDILSKSPLLLFLMDNDSLKIFWSILIGLAASSLLVVFLVAPYGFIASQNMYSQYETYQGHEWEAFLSTVCALLGIGQGTWIINNGQMETRGQSGERLARFGGPGVLTVQEGHAVILEKGGKLSRVVGSGLTWLEPCERVSMVVPLFGRSEHVIVEQVPTRDRVMLEQIEVLIFHRIDAGPEEEHTRDGHFVYNETRLRRMWSPHGGDWRNAVRSIGESAVRDIVGRYDLEQLVPMSENLRSKFKTELTQAINAITRDGIGVTVSGVDIGKIKIPEAAQRQLMEKWLADWAVRIAQSEREALIRKGEAEAVVLKIKEVAWAQAQKQIIEEIVAGFHNVSNGGPEAAYVVALRALETMEKMADDPATKVLLSPDVFTQLYSLREAIRSDMFALPIGRT